MNQILGWKAVLVNADREREREREEKQLEEQKQHMKLLSSSSSCSSATDSSSLPHTHSTAGSVLSPGKKRGVWHPRPASRSGRFRTSSHMLTPFSDAAPRLSFIGKQISSARMPGEDPSEIPDKHPS